MKRKNTMPVVAIALLLAVLTAGCGGKSEEQSADAAQQLWVVDNAEDAQEGYAMERPSATADLTTPVYYMAQERARTVKKISAQELIGFLNKMPEGVTLENVANVAFRRIPPHSGQIHFNNTD